MFGISIVARIDIKYTKMSEPVTTQPKSGDTLTVELPELDFHHMVKGEWKVGNFECLKNPPICKSILRLIFVNILKVII